MSAHITVGVNETALSCSFQADEILTPRRGFSWCARVGAMISRSDRYIDHAGTMEYAGLSWRSRARSRPARVR